MNPCTWKMVRGERKGEACGKNSKAGVEFCTTHLKLTVKKAGPKMPKPTPRSPSESVDDSHIMQCPDEILCEIAMSCSPETMTSLWGVNRRFRSMFRDDQRFLSKFWSLRGWDRHPGYRSCVQHYRGPHKSHIPPLNPLYVVHNIYLRLSLCTLKKKPSFSGEVDTIQAMEYVLDVLTRPIRNKYDLHTDLNAYLARRQLAYCIETFPEHVHLLKKSFDNTVRLYDERLDNYGDGSYEDKFNEMMRRARLKGPFSSAVSEVNGFIIKYKRIMKMRALFK